MQIIKSMRAFHRCLGYFTVGMMLIYSLSGTVLLFRSSDFLKTETPVQKTLQSNLAPDALGEALHLKNFKVEKQTPTLIIFSGNGIYDKASGKVSYLDKQYVFPLNKMASAHMLSTKTPLFVLGMFGGLSLFLLVVTSFFMYKPSSSQFRRGMIWVAAGLLFTILLLFMV